MYIKKCAKGFSLILLILATNCLVAQKKTIDFGLMGNVKSLSSVTTYYSNSNQTTHSGFLDSENFDSIYLEFDRKRNLVLRENYLDYRGNLGIFDRTLFHYNPTNQIEKKENFLIQNGEEPKKLAQEIKFYYLHNQLIRVDEFNSGRTSDQYWVVNWVYENGWLKEKIYWMEDQIFSKDEFEFNSFYQTISEKNYSNNGNINRYKFFENQRSGLPTRIVTQTGNEQTIEKFEYSNNYLKRREIIDHKGNTTLIEIFDTNGKLHEVKKYNYTNLSFDTYTFDYELDEKNNWVKCNISHNEQLKYQINRIINYY